MTPTEIRTVVLSSLKRIAPEIDPSTIPGTANLREECDLDSMDFMNFVLALHDRLGVEIPEAEYPHLYTLDGAVDYLAAKLPTALRASHE